MRAKVAFLLLIGTLSACATTQKPLYDWGNYSQTLYVYKQSPSDQTLKTHMDELSKIIEESGAQSLGVPPGVYVEYGFLLAKRGDIEHAKEYFELEKKAYPESAAFCDKVIDYCSTSIGRGNHE